MRQALCGALWPPVGAALDDDFVGADWDRSRGRIGPARGQGGGCATRVAGGCS